MFGIESLTYSTDLYLGISLFYTITILLFWKANITHFDSPTKKQPFLVLFIILHLLFAFDGGDYFHYYQYLLQRDMESMERVYTYIAEIVNYNYLLFRLIIWGGALILFQQTAKRFDLDPYRASFLLYLMFISLFSYARVSLAMAIFFYGVSFICNPLNKKKILSFLLGGGLIVISIPFHKSMLFTALATLMVFVPINRKSIIPFLLLFSLSTPLLKLLFNTFITPEYILNEEIIERVSILQSVTYGDSITGFSRYEWIRRFLEYSTFFIPFILLTFRLIKTRLLDLTSPVTKLYKVTLGIFILALSTYMMQFGNFILFYRYLYMAMIPVTLLVFYCRQHRVLSESQFMIVILLCLACKFFGVFKLLIASAS